MRRSSARRAEAGFTLLEALVVVAIIGITATVALPQVINYMRHYRIRGATQELATSLQQARMRAIMKSAQHGVVFAVENATTYWLHIEDDQGPLPRQGAREPLNMAAPDAAQSTRYQLPPLVVFADGAQCQPVGDQLPAAFAPTDGAVRFNRLGAICDPGSSATFCPGVTLAGGGLANLIQNAGAYSALCLLDTRSNLSRWVKVERGGRVEAQR